MAIVLEGLKKVASMVILKNQGRYLLLKRANEPNKGKYLPVGGKLDPFETPLDCAIRETFEETGISIINPKFCGLLTESSPLAYNWVAYIYLAEIDDLAPPHCDEGELEWIDSELLASINTPPTDLFIYQYVHKNIKFAFSAVYDKDMNLISMHDELNDEKVYPPAES
jgi:8-oxo-dGTP diphosphatase